MTEWISLQGGKQEVNLKLFSNTSLRDTAYINIRVLHDMIEWGYKHKKPMLYHWEDYENSDGKQTTKFTKIESKSNLTIQELINDCEEVKEYCKVYFPELMI